MIFYNKYKKFRIENNIDLKDISKRTKIDLKYLQALERRKVAEIPPVYVKLFFKAYINGIAGERFCVRNSGAYAVVEGIGDHGCEYMTGGVALILGGIGRNFAAGMSGGIAYIYNNQNEYDSKNFNMESIELEKPELQDLDIIYELVQNHFTHTNSEIAKQVLSNWELSKRKFIKVMPIEYKRALEKLAEEKINQIIN